MPFIEEVRRPQDVANIPAGDADKLPDPSLAETFGAAFRTQNMVGSYLASRGIPDPYEIEEDFDAIDYVKDDPKYAPYVQSFAGIFNRKAADALKLQIDRELQDRRTLDAAGGVGILAEMAAGVVDLPSLLPIGGAIAGGASGVVRSAAAIGIAAGLDAGVSEVGLQATQVTRTPQESALNIGGSIILGGALGALAGRYLAPAGQVSLARKIEAQPKAFDEFDQEFIAAGKRQSAGAAATDAGPTVLKDEKLFKALKGLNRQDPMIRLQLSDLDEARVTVRGLAETPLEYADNVRGVATEVGGSVETRMKMWNAPLANTLANIDTHFARYFHSTPEPSWAQIKLSPARSEFMRLTGRSQKMTYAEFRREVGKAAFSGEKHQIPEVAAAAAEYRKIDEAMKQAAIEAKLFPEDVAVKGDVSHLFRMYNREKIVAHRDEFARILQEHFTAKRNEAARQADIEAKVAKADAKADAAARQAEEFGRLTDAEIEDIVDETINTILGHAEGRIPYDGIVSGPRGPLKERLLSIESWKIQDFMELDIQKVLHAQVRTMSADVELARKFGSVDLKEQIKKINDEADRKIKGAKDAKERQRLEKQRKDAIRDVEGIRDRLRGTYRLPDNPDGLVLRAGRVIRSINYLRLLGGMTISAIPDMGKVIFTHGLTSTFRDGFVPMVRNFKAFRLAGEEVKAAGTALDMVLDSRTMALADITDDFGRHSRLERGIQAAQSKFGIVSLMAPWNAAMKQFAGMITMTNILKAAERVASGKPAKGDIRKLAAAGINEDLASRIWDQFAGTQQAPTGVVSGFVSKIIPGETYREGGVVKPVYSATMPTGPMPPNTMPVTGRAAAYVDDQVGWVSGRMQGQGDLLVADNGNVYKVRWDGLVELQPNSSLPTKRPPWAAPQSRPVSGTASRTGGHGKIVDGIYLPGGQNWTDREALEAFRAAVVRDVDRIVVTPGQDKPLWMSTEVGKMIGQFKSFGVSSVQKTMFAGIQQRDAAVLNGVMIMLALGAVTYKVKSDLAGRETSDKPSVWAVEAFDRSGIAGWLMEVNNAAEKITRGTVGFSAFTGEQVSRYASRNATASLLGPSLGTVQDILDVTGSAVSGEFSRRDLRKTFQLVPGQNIFYLRYLYEQVEKMTGDALGLEE